MHSVIGLMLLCCFRNSCCLTVLRFFGEDSVSANFCEQFCLSKKIVPIRMLRRKVEVPGVVYLFS